MDDAQLLRYSRQILLPEIDIEGQQRLLDAHVLIVGMGGLGSPAAIYLAAAGVGRLTIADFDRVELSNLQRQIIHSSGDLDRLKVDSAREHLLALNPQIQVDAIAQRMGIDELGTAAEDADVVVDASDNFATRFAVNDACHACRTPLVSGAATRFAGQICVLFPGRDDSPCYRCLFADDLQAEEERCATTGVVAPLLGIIGSVQAMETLKIITGVGTVLTNQILLLDALTMQWRSVRFAQDPACPVCG